MNEDEYCKITMVVGGKSIRGGWLTKSQYTRIKEAAARDQITIEEYAARALRAWHISQEHHET